MFVNYTILYIIPCMNITHCLANYTMYEYQIRVMLQCIDAESYSTYHVVILYRSHFALYQY